MSSIQKISFPKRVMAHTVLIVLAIPCLLPLVWMVSTSLKTDAQIFPVSTTEKVARITMHDLLPAPIRWENYFEAMQYLPFGTYLQNTLLLCITTLVFSVFSSALVAYGFSRTYFRGKKILFLFMLSTMMLPPQVTMIPHFMIFKKIGLYGSYWPLIIPSMLGIPFYIFLMSQFFQTIPMEIAESARIDGCSEWRIFWNMVLPLSVPVLATCSLFQFIGVWNDFMGPLIYLNDPSKYTIAYGLQQFLGALGGRWAQLMAGATVFTLPIIVLFFIAQKTFIQGIATTGGK